MYKRYHCLAHLRRAQLTKRMLREAQDWTR